MSDLTLLAVGALASIVPGFVLLAIGWGLGLRHRVLSIVAALVVAIIWYAAGYLWLAPDLSSAGHHFVAAFLTGLALMGSIGLIWGSLDGRKVTKQPLA